MNRTLFWTAAACCRFQLLALASTAAGCPRQAFEVTNVGDCLRRATQRSRELNFAGEDTGSHILLKAGASSRTPKSLWQ